MYYMEYEIPEDDVIMLLQEAVHDPSNSMLREQIIDPVIKILETPAGRNGYIKYGNDFLEANADMLSKEYPTKRVSFPRKYVDNVLDLFGFTVDSLKKTLKEILKQVRDNGNFRTILENPTNVVHTIVLFYSDMILHRQLRDSARQQLGISEYSAVLNKSFPKAPPNEATMAYTYMHLDGTWGLVKAENIMNWIGNTLDTAYAFWRTRLSVDMSPAVLAGFLGRMRTSFKQNMKLIAIRYYKDIDENNVVGTDVDGDDDYVVTNNNSKIRNNLIRLIKGGDELYHDKGKLYPNIAKLKNVKTETLYQLAKKVDHKDIADIIDVIFYVFINKEGNSIEDINSTKYIGRITNLPTAIDRAIQGKPIIIPMSKKYEFDSSIVKAYICFVATYIMMRINDVSNK